MRSIVFVLFIVIILSMLSASSYAQDSYIPLLAVNEQNMRGSIAHMYLSLRAGNGQIFIDSFPLTKIDTQMSTRFANRLACNLLNIDCTKLDFFYTIRAESSIIGGPSASAAAAVLTVALLDRANIKPGITVTGTINSGYVIGPVGGLKEKISAASSESIDTVLIPAGERDYVEGNESTDLVEYGKNLSVDVIEVSTLQEALSIMTDKDYVKKPGNLTVNKDYLSVMQKLSNMLCNRTAMLSREESLSIQLKNLNASYESDINNLSRRGKKMYSEGKYYSSASYCFAANVQLRESINSIYNFTQEEGISKANKVAREIHHFQDELDKRELKTIIDLQTYMIVSERLSEAMDSVNATLHDISQNLSFSYDLAFAQERLFSVYSWAEFFNNNGTVYDFGTQALQDSCTNKLSEADESYRYLQIYFPSFLYDSRKDYLEAMKDYKEGKYALCLFFASKSKAKSNVLLNVIGREEEDIDRLIGIKLNVTRDFLASQITDSQFPIVGYSYYEYSDALRESDPYSSLLFLEYALEIGNLDLYFTNAKSPIRSLLIDKSITKTFLLGFFFGCFILSMCLLIAILIYNRKIKTQQNTHDECSAGKKR